jgi:hypothetical protein
MTQLVELIKAERRRTEEQYEHVVARFEERLEMFDEMAEKARRLEEAEVDLTESKSGAADGSSAIALDEETAEDDEAVIGFLKTQKQPHSIPLIAMKTKLPSARVVAALNRLKNARRVHVVRIGAGNAFEAVGK